MRAPNFVIGDIGDPQVLRWHVIPRNRFANVYLHKFLRSDEDEALHDHPWVNCSVVLTGGYVEELRGGRRRSRRPWRPWAPWRLVFRRAATPHRIILLDERPVWTLFLTGPVVREWGFHCPSGWRHWRKFVQVRAGGNSRGRGCGE